MNEIKIRFDKIPMFTDSKVALGWIQGNPKRWKTFVANRVVKINQNVSEEKWLHVVCCIRIKSGGIYPSELLNHELWWHGPKILYDEEYKYSTIDISLGVWMDLRMPKHLKICMQFAII